MTLDFTLCTRITARVSVTISGADAFSLHATKGLATGEGGMVACTNAARIERIGQALNFGFSGSRESRSPSTNGKMSEYHAAVGLAEWLAITHGDQGIKVSCLCPQGVRTKMLFPDDEDAAKSTGAESVRMQGVIEPDELAEVVAQGLADERFLILPHPEVLDYWRRKTDDYDRWIGGMAKLRRSMLANMHKF